MADDDGVTLFAAPRRARKRPRARSPAGGDAAPPAAPAPEPAADCGFKELGLSDWLCR
jgi:hypothetical protein